MPRPSASSAAPTTTSGPGPAYPPTAVSTSSSTSSARGRGPARARPRRRHRQVHPRLLVPSGADRRRGRAGRRHARRSSRAVCPASRSSTARPRPSRWPTARSTPSPWPRRSTGSTPAARSPRSPACCARRRAALVWNVRDESVDWVRRVRPSSSSSARPGVPTPYHATGTATGRPGRRPRSWRVRAASPRAGTPPSTAPQRRRRSWRPRRVDELRVGPARRPARGAARRGARARRDAPADLAGRSASPSRTVTDVIWCHTVDAPAVPTTAGRAAGAAAGLVRDARAATCRGAAPATRGRCSSAS